MFGFLKVETWRQARSWSLLEINRSAKIVKVEISEHERRAKDSSARFPRVKADKSVTFFPTLKNNS